MSSSIEPIGRCEKCAEKYIDRSSAKKKWCKHCQINSLKRNFINWTCGNEQIDDFIQEMQLRINNYDDKIFEWIPYDQFIEIKEKNKGKFSTLYSAKWKGGPLQYDSGSFKRNNSIREYREKVALKCFYYTPNIINEFLNEVRKF
jgi:hypothetical protein